MEVLVADIGGTHARFAIAKFDNGTIHSLSRQAKLKTADYATLALAWHAYAKQIEEGSDCAMPRRTAIAIAGPVNQETIKFTNNSWVIHRANLAKEINVDDFILLNDFEAVAHTVAVLGDDHFSHVCGPKQPADLGVTTIIGPGTGLGVAHLSVTKNGYFVGETEGGHVDFAPLDSWEDNLLKGLRAQHGRVSVERVLSGPALRSLYNALSKESERLDVDDKDLWTLALEGKDERAVAALDRFLLSYGAIAGDLALAHGANKVILTGGLGMRLVDHIPSSGFSGRFSAKGRFQSKMEQITVQQLRYDEPGLYGAAAAYLKSIQDI